jgi:hypothetical protein
MAFFDFVIAFSEADPALAHHGYSFPLEEGVAKAAARRARKK